MEITVDVSELIDFGDGLMVSQRIVAEESRRAMERSATLVQNDAKRNIQRQNTIDTGQLLNSIARRVEPFEARIGSNKQYARVIEEGRRPGAPMPPSGSLLGWMSRHGIPAEAEFVIRRAIARRGIASRPYLVPALEGNRRAIEREFAAAADRMVKRVMP